jgi:hypothetical protein
MAPSFAATAGILFICVSAFLPYAQGRPCSAIVSDYWQGLEKGNFSAAMAFVAPNVSFEWPGDNDVLPMAGTWVGPIGIESFFGVVGKYFNFAFCPGKLPVINPLTTRHMNTVFAFWEECSTSASNSSGALS